MASAIAGTDKVVLKFEEGTGIRLRDDKFASLSGVDLAELEQVLARHPSLDIEPLFSRGGDELDREKPVLEERSGQEMADLNLYYLLSLSTGADGAAIINELNDLSVVEISYPAPVPVPFRHGERSVSPNGGLSATSQSPDYTTTQGYLDPAPDGIDARYAWTVPGGAGQGSTVVDVEMWWNRTHEDLSKARDAYLSGNGLCVGDFGEIEHGTAVLGEIAADPNGLGVTGAAWGAALRLISVYRPGSCQYAVADAVDVAASGAGPGDVILIEQQMGGPLWGGDLGNQYGMVPVEYHQAEFDAIQRAVARGIVVVEAAGNGHQNLDDPMYVTHLNRTDRYSGAIMVGAGAAPCFLFCNARSALDFSNYGQRVDLQGWGESVATTGYGSLQGGNDPNNWYTNQFSGTSSASPIVAAAVASLQGVARAATGRPLTPPDVLADW